jgi:hypothetical protein
VDNRGAMMVIFWFFVTMATLIVLWLIVRARAATGLRLTVAGIVLALVALWYGLLNGLPDQRGLPVVTGNLGLADTALKLAAVLVLGGIVVTLLVHDTATVTYVPPEHPHNAPPSL